LLLLHDDLADWAALHLDPGWLSHSLVRQIIASRIEAHKGHRWTGLAAFLDQWEVPEIQNLITEATADARPLPNPPQQLADVCLRLRNQAFERQMAALMLRLNQPDISEEDRLSLLRQQQELRALKRQPLAGDRATPGARPSPGAAT
jgi:hypothetical protein